ncbi:MAG TPA: nicotinamide-nucleotide amidohydrolase family protein [Cyclobacteriaceae bacterium]
MYKKNVINLVAKALIDRNETISVAESVTAGHLQLALSLGENARQYFQGGITAYNIGQKARLLNVEPIHAENCNGVSNLIAEQMALRASEMFTSTWSIGVTGYAAPVPECNITSLFAYCAIYHDHKLVISEKLTSTYNDVLKVQEDYVNLILIRFYKTLCLS